MDAGERVPDNVVIGMVREKLSSIPAGTGVVFDGFPRTSAQASGLSMMLQELGMKIVSEQSYDPKSLDFTSIVQKIKMKKPHVVAFQCYIDDGFRLFRDARKNGLNPKLWWAQGAVNAEVPDAFERFGDDMNYIMATNQVSGGNIRNLSPLTQTQFKDFLRRYKAKYGENMQSEADIVYTAATVLFEFVLPAAG